TETATPEPTNTPTITPTPTATPTPIDVVEVMTENLPPILVGLSIMLVVVVLGAGLSLVRGPRDI
ncbi:MAG: hypothetical protein KDE54_29720, partial [Caldilineaceae bacterium]|nr:hypothetical protein [Caldilineaceae bacterium]